MLYFHPWEFDPGQPRLPLRGAQSVPHLRRHPEDSRPAFETAGGYSFVRG